jgi:hypothetical protein
MQDQQRIIKKYPSRRLYGAAVSAYIRLEDIRRPVRKGTEFRVMDAVSDVDITRGLPLRIVLEQKALGGADCPTGAKPILGWGLGAGSLFDAGRRCRKPRPAALASLKTRKAMRSANSEMFRNKGLYAGRPVIRVRHAER